MLLHLKTCRQVLPLPAQNIYEALTGDPDGKSFFVSRIYPVCCKITLDIKYETMHTLLTNRSKNLGTKTYSRMLCSTSIVSNPVYTLTSLLRSSRHSSGVVFPQVFRINLRFDTNIELSLRT